jgi:hypothetical protein
MSTDTGSEKVRKLPGEARGDYVGTDVLDHVSGTLPLHQVILSRQVEQVPLKQGEIESPGIQSVRLSTVQVLLSENPEATAVRCRKLGYTPLHYAVSTPLPEDKDDLRTVLEEDAAICKLLLQANQHAFRLRTADGICPMSLHIMAVSRIQSVMFPDQTAPSKAALRALIKFSDRIILEEALHTLYRCNTSVIMQRFAAEERRAARNVQQFGRQTTASIADFWVWEWAFTILEGIHYKTSSKDKSSRAPFHALHTAAQVKDCPTPFLLFALRAYASETRVPDPKTGNLPLHHVAAWKTDKGSTSRKDMSLTSLVAEFPASINRKNKQGKTPVQLEQGLL